VTQTPPYGSQQDPSLTRLENLLLKHNTNRPQEVTVVSAHTAGEKLAMALVGALIMVPLGGLLIMWLTSLVSVVPDLSFTDSMGIYVLGGLIFRGGFSTSWIKDKERKR
jgi:hypothetical protein